MRVGRWVVLPVVQGLLRLGRAGLFERAERKGGDLFIVDNSLSQWTGLKYLDQWIDVARSV